MRIEIRAVARVDQLLWHSAALWAPLKPLHPILVGLTDVSTSDRVSWQAAFSGSLDLPGLLGMDFQQEALVKAVQ